MLSRPVRGRVSATEQNRWCLRKAPLGRLTYSKQADLVCILSASSHPWQEGPKEQMHPVGQVSEMQQTFRVLLTFGQRPDVWLGAGRPLPQLQTAAYSKHGESHFKNRLERFPLFSCVTTAVIFVLKVTTQRTDGTGDRPQHRRARRAHGSWALLPRGLTSRGPQQREGGSGGWRPQLWRQVQRRATQPLVSEGWAWRTDIWPFKISVWDFKSQLSFEHKAFWEKITCQEGEAGWASSEKLSPLHLKQRKWKKFSKWFARW